MKFFALISVLCVSVALAACGGDDESATASLSIETSKGLNGGTLEEVKGTGAKPKIQIPPGPPPKKLVVKQLKEGIGRGSVDGDRLGVRYVGIEYKTGKSFEDRWTEPAPLNFILGDGDVVDGWETGLKGMKLGGRRELTVPARLGFGGGVDLIYQIELLSREK